MSDDDRPTAADLEAAGLFDPDAADAPQQLALLDYLLDVGATMDDLLEAGPGELPIVGSRIALWGARSRLSLDEIAEAAQIDRTLVSSLWRAVGFPEPDPDPNVRTFSQKDAELLMNLQGGIEFFGEEVTIQLARVLGAAAARVADASVSAFVANIIPQRLEDDPSGLELTRANVESMVLLDSLTHGFDTLLRHQIEQGFRPGDLIDRMSGIDMVRRSVGFADLVDSTAWTQQLELPALSLALSEFDSSASEIVAGLGGRVVKLIGDGVMFATEDPVTATEIALQLVEAFVNHETLPPLRVGIATGNVLARDGDFSGAVVNLAARAVNVARPSTVLVDPETRLTIDTSDAYNCRVAGAFKLKGFERRVRLSRVKRASSDGDDDA